TLDTKQDYELIDAVFNALLPTRPDFTLADILTLLKAHPDLRGLNDHVAHRWV
ncbi:MAG: spore coat biosynthesis protein F, partial [Magnetospirillum sp.]|nr:spore coat biosynthesis protein F [Magnetospirillum sp.]